MQDAFTVVIWVVTGLGAVIALITFVTSQGLYDQIGKGGLYTDDETGGAPRAPDPGSAAGLAERDAEVRQMLTAQNERRARAGKPQLDVEDELRRLTTPQVDAAVRQEIVELVHARNARRERRGQPPLDVEQEVARQLAALGG